MPKCSKGSEFERMALADAVKKSNGAIRNSNDADNPLLWNQVPLLTCDVWEHPYYIDYRNERPKYIDAFWQIANWEFAAMNFASDQA